MTLKLVSPPLPVEQEMRHGPSQAFVRLTRNPDLTPPKRVSLLPDDGSMKLVNPALLAWRERSKCNG